jgi:hypothetical protein
VQLVGEELACRGYLNEAAAVHDGNSVGQLAYHGEIMSDKHVSDVQSFAEVGEQAKNLRPDADVERANRLVKEEDAWFGGDRTRDSRTLLLAATQLFRSEVGSVCRESNLEEQIGHALRSFGTLGESVDSQHLLEGRSDRHPWVEAAQRILEDHSDWPPPATGKGLAGDPNCAGAEGSEAHRRPG